MSRAFFPAERAPSDPPPESGRGRGLFPVVSVLVDRSGSVGPLSYRVPQDVTVRRGDAVRVPFGKKVSYGLVLGPGDTTKATRDIEVVYGKRVTPGELDFAQKVADTYFCTLGQVASRLAPRDGKGAAALDVGEVALVAGFQARLPEFFHRRTIVTTPLADHGVLAAAEAHRLSPSGQVLVLCPTKEVVESVLSHFATGAVRLDTKAPPGAWKGFVSGSCRIGVGTCASALYSAHNLAAMVVVNEEHPGHRHHSQPYTNARDLAIMRTAATNTALVLTATSPTPRSLGAGVKAVRWGTARDWPRISVHPAREFPGAPLPPVVGRLDPLAVLVDTEPRFVCARCSSLRTSPRQPCSRCGATEAFQANWDASRVKRTLPNAQAVLFSDLRANMGSVLVPNITALLRHGSHQPEVFASTVLVKAAQAAGRQGTLVVLADDPNHPLLASFVQRQQLAMAERIWSLAREADLPPFATWVRVLATGKTAPRTDTWPGQVFGPRRVKDEWEIVVKLPKKGTGFSAHLDGLRRGRKVRVELL